MQSTCQSCVCCQGESALGSATPCCNEHSNPLVCAGCRNRADLFEGRRSGRISVAPAWPCLAVLDDGMKQARYDSQPNVASINAHWFVPPATIRAKPSRRAKSDHHRHVTTNALLYREARCGSLAKNAEHVLSPLALGNKASRIAEAGICSAFP